MSRLGLVMVVEGVGVLYKTLGVGGGGWRRRAYLGCRAFCVGVVGEVWGAVEQWWLLGKSSQTLLKGFREVCGLVCWLTALAAVLKAPWGFSGVLG